MNLKLLTHKLFWTYLWIDIRYTWPNNIKRIWRFIRPLCSDTDYELSPGIYHVLRAKLVRLEKVTREGRWSGPGKDSTDIVKVIEALDRLIADEYFNESRKAIWKKWGVPAFDFVPTDSGNFRMVNRLDEFLDERELEQKRKESDEASLEEERKRQLDINLVFNSMRDNILEWWN